MTSETGTIQVILTVPPGVERSIFPWGVWHLHDYLQYAGTPSQPRVWNLHNDACWKRLFETHAELIIEAYKTLRWEVSRNFSINITNPYCFLGVLAHFGPSFFDITHRYRLLISPPVARVFYDHHRQELQQLQRTFAATLEERIRRQIDAARDSKRLWGVSCYDYTIFNSLKLALTLKEMDPESVVVLGGEAFDHQTASAVTKQVRAVDAIVVGFGEEVLTDLVHRCAAGQDVRRVKMSGLVNEESVSTEPAFEPDRDHLAILSQDGKSKPLQYVRMHGPSVLRIQTQRGCAWAKCTFCAYLGRHDYDPFSPDLLAEQTRDAVAALRSRGSQRSDLFRVFLDSDECKPEHLAAVLDNIRDLKEQCEVLRVVAWVSVRDINLPLLRAIAGAAEAGISVVLRANTESLNVQTLRRMRKGHFPLHAVEAYKAAQDCGQYIMTNYFSWYPKETAQDIEDEIQLLERIAHLFGPTKGSIAVGAYEANTRDSVSRKPNEYNCKIATAAGSPWMSEAFGLRMPFGIYDAPLASYDTHSIGGLANRCFLETLRWDAARLPAFARNQSRSLNSVSFWLYWHSHRLFWSLLNRVCSSAFRSPLAERHRLLRYFETGWHLPEGGKEVSSSFRLVETSHYFELHKSYRLPGCREEWTRKLDDTEIKVLRYLYWYRKRSDVHQRFRNEMETATIETVIDRHLDLGSLVGIGDNLLSVFHDPGWWMDEVAVADGEQIRRLA